MGEVIQQLQENPASVGTQPVESRTESDLAPRIACQRCEQPSRVTILLGYVGGIPVRRHLCISCAEYASDEIGLDRASVLETTPTLSSASVALLAGVLLALIGLLADEFDHRGSHGFGQYQVIAVVAGALFVMIGALLRANALAVVGVILFGLGALADAFGRVGTPGIGWRQQMTIAVGLLLLCLGLYLRKRTPVSELGVNPPPKSSNPSHPTRIQ